MFFLKSILFILFFVFSCKDPKDVNSIINLKELDTEKNIRPYSFESSYIFKVSGLKKKGVLIGLDTINFICTNKIADWDSSQYKIQWMSTSNNRYTNSYTGIIQNSDQIWIHPPRSYEYKILELSAFPFVQIPLEVGKEWDWSLSVGEHWAYNLSVNWKGSMIFNHQYRVTEKNLINTNMGKLECFKIEATTLSNLGESTSIFYYNNKYGFVEMEYRNIDQTHITFQLINIKHNDINYLGRFGLINK